MVITTKFKEIRLLYNICHGKIKYFIIQFCILQLHLQIKLGTHKLRIHTEFPN